MQNLLLNETLKAGPSYKPLHPLGSDTHILYIHYSAPTRAHTRCACVKNPKISVFLNIHYSYYLWHC